MKNKMQQILCFLHALWFATGGFLVQCQLTRHNKLVLFVFEQPFQNWRAFRRDIFLQTVTIVMTSAVNICTGINEMYEV